METFYQVTDPGFDRAKAREIIRDWGFVRLIRKIEGVEVYAYPPVPSMIFCVGTALLLCVAWDMEEHMGKEELKVNIEYVIQSIRRSGIY